MSACDLVQIIAIFNFVRISVLYNQHTSTITNTIIITTSTTATITSQAGILQSSAYLETLTNIMESKNKFLKLKVESRDKKKVQNINELCSP